jgi:hypothetical protein
MFPLSIEGKVKVICVEADGSFTLYRTYPLLWSPDGGMTFTSYKARPRRGYAWLIDDMGYPWVVERLADGRWGVANTAPSYHNCFVEVKRV